MLPSLEKTKYGGKAIENVKSIYSSNKETDLGTILIGANPISCNYSSSSPTLQTFFKLNEMEERLVEVKQKQPTTNEGCFYKGISIQPSK